MGQTGSYSTELWSPNGGQTDKRHIIHHETNNQSIWSFIKQLQSLTESWWGSSCTLLLWTDSPIPQVRDSFLKYYKRHHTCIKNGNVRTNVTYVKKKSVCVCLTSTRWCASAMAEREPSWQLWGCQACYSTHWKTHSTNVLSFCTDERTQQKKVFSLTCTWHKYCNNKCIKM